MRACGPTPIVVAFDHPCSALDCLPTYSSMLCSRERTALLDLTFIECGTQLIAMQGSVHQYQMTLPLHVAGCSITTICHDRIVYYQSVYLMSG